MKTIKTLLSATALVAIFSMGAFAQANVEVTAEVQQALTLTPTDIALGTISTGVASIIRAGAADVTTVEANLGSTASPGSLQIVGLAASTVTVSWENAVLTNGTPADDATFTPIVFNGATSVSNGGTVTITAGDITLGVGGTLAAPSGTGSYTTVGATAIVLTVEYN